MILFIVFIGYNCCDESLLKLNYYINSEVKHEKNKDTGRN